MVFYLVGTKLEAKAKLRAKSVNLEIKWVNVRHREKLVPKVQAWRTLGLKCKKKRFYSIRLYFDYVRIINIKIIIRDYLILGFYLYLFSIKCIYLLGSLSRIRLSPLAL